MVNGIEHVAVVSKDTAALKDWYMEMYGGRVVYDNGKGTYFLQFADGSMIEFVMATDDKTADVEKQAGIRHLAFSVTAKGLKTYWYRDIEGNFSHLIYRPEPLM